MEFAFPSLVIFLLLLSGIIFNYAYLRGLGRREGPVAMKRYREYLVHATIYALILNATWGFFFSLAARRCFSWNVQWYVLLRLLMGGQQIKENQVEIIADHLFGIAVYLLSLYLLSAILGTLAHGIVRRLRLDKRYEIFRPDDLWFYLLSGEILEFPKVTRELWGIEEDITKNIDLKGLGVFLTAFVHHGEKTFLYGGFVWDFGYTRDGNLDWIALRFPVRIPHDEETAPTASPLSLFQRFRHVSFGREFSNNPFTEGGDERTDFLADTLLVLQYAEMSAITLTYIYMKKKEERKAEPEGDKRVLNEYAEAGK